MPLLPKNLFAVGVFARERAFREALLKFMKRNKAHLPQANHSRSRETLGDAEPLARSRAKY